MKYPLANEEHIVHKLPLLHKKKHYQSIINWKCEKKDFPTDTLKHYLIMFKDTKEIFSDYLPLTIKDRAYFVHRMTKDTIEWSNVYWCEMTTIKFKG